MNKVVNEIKKLLSTGFLHIFGTSVVNKVITFAMSVVVVRILTKTEYGLFTYAWNIYSIAALFSGFGLSSAIVQLCSETNRHASVSQSIYRYCLDAGLKFNVLLAVIIATVALRFPLKVSGAKYLLLMLSGFPLFAFFYDGTLSYIRSTKNNILYSRITLLNTSALLVFTLLLVLVFKEYGMVLGYFMAYSVSSIYGWKKIAIPKKTDAAEISTKRNALKIGGISMVNNGLSELLYLLDVFIIGFVIANEQVIAAYKVATQIPTALSFFPVTLAIYLYPYFAEKRQDKQWCLNNYKKTLLIVGSLNFCITAVLFGFAPFIIRIIYGNVYLDALVPFRILVVSYFFSGTFRIIAGNLLVTQRKLKVNLFVTIVSSITNIIADYFLIKHWGSNGAAVATLIVMIVSSILSTCYLLYYLNKGAKREKL